MSLACVVLLAYSSGRSAHSPYSEPLVQLSFATQSYNSYTHESSEVVFEASNADIRIIAQQSGTN